MTGPRFLTTNNASAAVTSTDTSIGVSRKPWTTALAIRLDNTCSIRTGSSTNAARLRTSRAMTRSGFAAAISSIARRAISTGSAVTAAGQRALPAALAEVEQRFDHGQRTLRRPVYLGQALAHVGGEIVPLHGSPCDRGDGAEGIRSSCPTMPRRSSLNTSAARSRTLRCSSPAPAHRLRHGGRGSPMFRSGSRLRMAHACDQATANDGFNDTCRVSDTPPAGRPPSLRTKKKRVVA